MLDYDKLAEIVENYKKEFSEWWPRERYKWEAVKHFQDYWDINAPDFSEMFAKATKKTDNLLGSLSYPREAITNWSKKNPELFRDMFEDLYDESKDLYLRVKNFMSSAESYHKELNDGGKQHYQNTNAISTYLWLRYPDKYYIYRYSTARAFARVLKYPEVPKKSSDPNEMLKAFKMYNEIRDVIKSDNELINLVKTSLTGSCYSDPEFITLTGDIGYYISKSEKTKYWIIGAGEGAYLWDEFYKDKIVAIGWDTGDLRNYKSKKEIRQKLIENSNNDSIPKHDHNALWDFCNEMKKGDIVYVKKGKRELIGRGIVKSDYRFEDRSDGYSHVRDVEWTHNEVHKFDHNVQWTLEEKSELAEELEALFNQTERGEISMKEQKQPLNQILYGPPGTGKTRNTVIYAVSIIDEKDVKEVLEEAKNNYEDVYKRFKKYRDEGRIEFITFHQSYSYEEFVEGIKPDVGDDGDEITYNPKPGIFKEICTKAGTKGNFEECYQHFIDDISEEDLFKLKTPTKKQDFAVSVRQNGSLKLYTGPDLQKVGSLTKEKLRNTYNNILPNYHKSYYMGVVEELKKKYNLSQNGSEKEKQYVLIIDEINRGNISKIFGELITLIEEDKREKWTARLPYSKETFTVPKNLWIIGTMNTADRSIATIDIALRRRFRFVEMMPDSSLLKDVEDINLKELMDNLNKRITVLIDRDHQIGHAYFMNIDTLDKLKDAWFNKILPLLNEYFYGDWNKLKLVVKPFIDEKDVPEDLKEEYGDEKLYSFKSEEDVDFVSDLKGLYTNKEK